MYQRSGDIGLGIPFNIASYALLLIMIAHCVDMIPDEFIHVIGDAHIYNNHIYQLREQLIRDPYPFPTLLVNTDNKDILKFKYQDFVINNYVSHPGIKMDMSA
jgi:thymidylate synthase